MSQQHQDNDRHLADFTGIILILTFVVIFAVISSGSQSLSLMPAVPTDDSQEVVVQVVPTNTVEPTSPPLAPTITPTSAPTSTTEPTALPSSTPPPAATAVQESAVQAAENISVGNYDPALVQQGATLFALCAACHGPEGHGIPNLGKDLVTSEFVHSLTDEDLLTFIKTGRPLWDPLNTTGIDMPPKGGNPALSDEEIMALIAYIRSFAPATSSQTEEIPSEDIQTASYDPALVQQGATLFALCAACHGPEGQGIPNLGKDLVASEFVHSLTDEDLLTFIKTGRPLWDPLNTTGIDMPPKGGNPALSDEEIMALIAYIRSLSPTR